MMKNDALSILLKEKQELSQSMKSMGEDMGNMCYVGVLPLLSMSYMMINKTIRHKYTLPDGDDSDIAFYRIKNMVYDYVIPILVSLLWRFLVRKIKTKLYI